MSDREIIERLGGVKVVSEHLGYNYTTVHNWLTRGISVYAKVEHPELFMPKDIKDLRPLKKKEE